MADQETELLERGACGRRRPKIAVKLAALIVAGVLVIGGCASIVGLPSTGKPELERPGTQLGTERISLLAEVPFDVDESELTPEGGAHLNELVANLRNVTTDTILVTGHSVSFGSDTYNKALSERRAAVVKGYLGEEKGTL